MRHHARRAAAPRRAPGVGGPGVAGARRLDVLHRRPHQLVPVARHGRRLPEAVAEHQHRLRSIRGYAPDPATASIAGDGQPTSPPASRTTRATPASILGTRVRSGFLGSIIAFGMKRQITEWTSVKSYISLWGTSEAYARDRTNDGGHSHLEGLRRPRRLDRDRGAVGLARRRPPVRDPRRHLDRDRFPLRPQLRRRPALPRDLLPDLRAHRDRRARARGSPPASPTRRRRWAGCTSRRASTIRSVCSARGNGFRIRGRKARSGSSGASRRRSGSRCRPRGCTSTWARSRA